MVSMANPELLKYVREQSTAGIVPDEIKKTLLTAGWSEEDVNAALAEISLRTTTQSAPQPVSSPNQEGIVSQPHSDLVSYAQAKKQLHRKKYLLIALVVLVIVAAGGFAGYYLFVLRQ
jgi:hypothetical protein